MVTQLEFDDNAPEPHAVGIRSAGFRGFSSATVHHCPLFVTSEGKLTTEDIPPLIDNGDGESLPSAAMLWCMVVLALQWCWSCVARWRLVPLGRFIGAAAVIMIMSMWIGVASANDTATTPISHSAHWLQERAIYMPVQAPAAPSAPTQMGGRVKGYVAYSDSGSPLVVGPDTMADVTLISPSKVDPSWHRYSAGTVHMQGIGYGNATEKVTVPIRQQWGATVDYIDAFIGPTPTGVDMILGVDHLRTYEASIDTSTDIMVLQATKLIIQLDSFAAIQSRMASPPITVLATNSGCNLAFISFMNLGFRIKEWLSVELDSDCRAVSSQLIPQHILTHVPPHDTTKVGRGLLAKHVDVHIDTSPCQPWSRLSDSPRGFADPHSQPFVAANRIYNQLCQINPHIKFLAENVQPSAAAIVLAQKGGKCF